MDEDVSTTICDNAIWVSFDRPAARNALRAQTVAELQAVFGAVNEETASCLVITGVGSAFCAGQDLREAEAQLAAGPGAEELRQGIEHLQQLTRLLLNCPLPTVAAINGPAVGAGAELALCCDIRVGSPSASFQFPEISRGQLGTNGSTVLLPRLVGPGRAALLTLTGRTIDATISEQWGLLDQVATSEDLETLVDSLAAELSTGSRNARTSTLISLRDRIRFEVEAAMKRETDDLVSCLLTGDAQQAASDYLENHG